MNNETFFLLLGLLLYFILAQRGVSGTSLQRHWNKKIFFQQEQTELNRLKRSRPNSGCPEGCVCAIRGNDHKSVRCLGLRKTKIPEKIPADVSSLNLAYNRIEMVEAEPLSELKYLESMDLSHNKINTIRTNAFKDLSRVKWIDLSHNNLLNLSLADFSEAARNLITLNISNTNLKEIPRLHDDKGLYMTRLHHLIVLNNNFTDIPAGRIPSSVTNVHFSCLKMKTLPRSAFQGQYMLKEVVIRGCEPKNKILSIEDGSFDSLKVLEKLDLSRNSLLVVPRGLPSSLEYLDLSHNQISSIKRGACANTEDIFNHFAVEEDEANFKDFGVGSELSRLSNLIELQLNDNFIESLCVDDFIFMRHLEVLNLTNCAIKSFHRDTFLYSQSLRVLDLSRNNIRKFEMAEHPDLEELYVERNFIAEVTGLTNSKLPSLREADFSYNRYTCDCKLKDFFHFLAGSYNQDVIFRSLSATSTRYTCFKPNRLRNKPLMSVDIDTQLTCGEETTPLPWPAIAAPVSLVGFVVVVIVILCILRVRSGKSGCCCRCKRRPKQATTVTSNYAKYDVDSDIVIQTNPTNNIAILCHDTNQKWILNTLVQKLSHSQPVNAENLDLRDSNQSKPLNVEVFTIGKTIQIDTLHRCIDTNRRIALILTHEFLKEKACLYVLKVMQERTVDDPKDAVLCVMMDSIPWQNMPKPLQKLMVEKTFLQYPQKDRERQEFYFWDNLNSLLITSSPAKRREWQDDKEEIATSARYHKYYDQTKIEEEENCNIRSSRRAGQNIQTSDANISSTRAARLQRLGIKSNGEVIDKVLPGITEAKQVASKRNLPNRDDDVVSQPERRSNLISQPSSYIIPNSPTTIPVTPLPTHNAPIQPDEVLKDIDDLYSTRKDIFLFGANRSRNGRVHSLLPPNCDDVDSIYSDDEEDEKEYVRPPERGRSSEPAPKLPKKLHKRHETAEDSNGAVENQHDVIHNLHGTAVAVDEQLDDDEIDEDAQSEEEVEEKNEKTKKKKRKTLSRLRSLF